jgi:hypothetical protein
MGEYVPGAPINDEVRKSNQNLPGMGGVFNVVNLHVYHYAGNNPVKYTDPDGEVINLAAAGFGAAFGGAAGAAIAFAQGKSGREIVAAAVGGAVTGGMAGLTMGGSLVVSLAAGGLASTAGYMASNVVKGENHTVEGTATSFVYGAAGEMAGQTIGKLGEIATGTVNRSYTNYIQNTNTSSVQPLETTFKETYNKIDTNARWISGATRTAQTVVDQGIGMYADSVIQRADTHPTRSSDYYQTQYNL